jgi:hypothetical protein
MASAYTNEFLRDAPSYSTLETCVNDVQNLVNEFKDLMTQFQAEDYTSAILNAVDLVQELPKTLKDCGLDSVANIKGATFDHLKHVGYSEGCLADLDTIGTDALDLFDMVKNGDVDLAKAVVDAKGIMATLPNVVKDCQLLPDDLKDLPPVESYCAWDLNNLVTISLTLEKDITAKNIPSIKSDLGELYQGLLLSAKNCKDPQTTYDALVMAIMDNVPLPSGSNKEKCQADLDKAYPDIV